MQNFSGIGLMNLFKSKPNKTKDSSSTKKETAKIKDLKLWVPIYVPIYTYTSTDELYLYNSSENTILSKNLLKFNKNEHYKFVESNMEKILIISRNLIEV